MSYSALAGKLDSLPRRARHRLGDERIDDDLLRHFVDSLFTALISLYASMAMGMLATLCGWWITGDPLLLFLAGVHVVVGIVRIAIVVRYKSVGPEQRARAEILAYDRVFLFFSTIYALLIGIMSARLLLMPDVRGAESLAMGATVGFTIAFITRSSGRLRTLVAQILGVSGPVLFVYLAFPIPHGAFIAVTLCGLIVTTVIMGFVANSRIAELYHANAQARRIARMDMLTGLFNRFSFSESLDAALRDAPADPHASFAIIIVDLDRFKEINDTLGHNVGDAVIVETARRLTSVAGKSDFVARLGGDEFVIMTELRGDAGAPDESIGQRAVAALAETMDIDDMPLSMTASIGLAVYPQHGASAKDLMKSADIALYEAKRRGRNTACTFDASMRARMEEERILQAEMQSAIGLGQFEPWFQPICELETGRPVCFEALARWRHPVRGLVQPGIFIPLAEQSGAIIALGEQILEKSCAIAASWPAPLPVSVNLSPVQFRRPEYLVAKVKEIVIRTGIAPERLYLELTESLLMEDTIQTRDAVEQLARFGVRFALDDFGAGYSSLSYIQSYPFAKIKIDKKFVDQIESDRTSSAIIAAVRILAERIDVELVAEGVETERQHHALRALGVTRGQGFLYGRPAPEARFLNAPRELVETS